MISGFAQTTPLTRSPLPLFLPIPTFCVPVVLPSFALYRFTSCMHVGLFSFYVDVALSRGLRITPAGIDRMGNTSRSGWHTTWEWLRGLHWASILLLPFCFTSLLLSFPFSSLRAPSEGRKRCNQVCPCPPMLSAYRRHESFEVARSGHQPRRPGKPSSSSMNALGMYVNRIRARPYAAVGIFGQNIPTYNLFSPSCLSLHSSGRRWWQP